MDYKTSLDILNKLKEPFPEEIIKYREGPYDKIAKQTQYFKYIPSEHLQERLDSILGLGWSWEITKAETVKIIKEVKQYSKEKDENGRSSYSMVEKEVEQVIVLGKLTLRLPDDTTSVRDSLGGCDVTYGVQAGDPFKIASSNAFKKACLEFGIGRYIAIEAAAQKPARVPAKQKFTWSPQLTTQAPVNTSGVSPSPKNSNPFRN